jgi:hypothetical protein
MGFTVGITAALGGFLVFASGSNRLEADSESESQLNYAAESAMAMGLRWLRTYPASKTGDKTWPATPIVLNSGTGDFTLMEGVWVKVGFLATPQGFVAHKLQCFATFGTGRDTLEINYYLAQTQGTAEDEAGTTLYDLTMSQRRQTIHPGK